MAADVRDSEFETMQYDMQEPEGALSYPSSSDSRVTLNSEISSIPENEKESIPSHLIVQKQMKDVILSQRAAVQKLVRYNIDSLNASKQSFNITFESQEGKIKQLEHSIQKDFVPKEAHSELRQKLHTECEEHNATKANLSEMQNQFASSQHRLAQTQHQMNQEREKFTSSSDAFKEKIFELQEQNSKLQFLLKEKTLQCDEMKGQVLQQTAHIEKQSKKHEEHKVKLKQQVTEAEVKRQQEAYLTRMLTEKSMKKKNI